MSATIPQANSLLYAISPTVALYLSPVQKTADDVGIRLELVSAATEGNKAFLKFTLQDLSGNRINESIDLLDQYRLYKTFDSSARSQFLGFDAETQKASFLVEIINWNGETIPRDKLKFSLNGFLSGQKQHDLTLDTIDLSALDDHPTTRAISEVSGFSAQYPAPDEAGSYTVLKSEQKALATVEGASITAIGYKKNQLHVQVLYDNNLTKDDHGYVYLIGKNNSNIHPAGSISFRNSNSESLYVEYVFDIDHALLKEYVLGARFWTGGEFVEGNWALTFALD